MGAAVLCTLAAMSIQDMQRGFGKLCSLGNSPTGATGRGGMAPSPCSHHNAKSQWGCAAEIGKDLAWGLGSQSSLLRCHLALCNPRPPCRGCVQKPAHAGATWGTAELRKQPCTSTRAAGPCGLPPSHHSLLCAPQLQLHDGMVSDPCAWIWSHLQLRIHLCIKATKKKGYKRLEWS